MCRQTQNKLKKETNIRKMKNNSNNFKLYHWS